MNDRMATRVLADDIFVEELHASSVQLYTQLRYSYKHKKMFLVISLKVPVDYR